MLADAKLKASTTQGVGKQTHERTYLVTCIPTLELQAAFGAIVD